jgi:hypothetical protein
MWWSEEEASMPVSPDAALTDLVQLLDVLRVGANPGRDLRVLVAAG